MSRILNIQEMSTALDESLPGWEARDDDWRREQDLEQQICAAIRRACAVFRRQGDAAALDFIKNSGMEIGIMPLIFIANIIWLSRRMGNGQAAALDCLEFGRQAFEQGYDDLGLEACSAAMMLDTHGDYIITKSPEQSRTLADMYENVARRNQHRFQFDRIIHDPPVRVGLVVSNLVDHFVGYTKTVCHFARYYDRTRYALRVYSSENLAQRDLHLFPFGGSEYRSEKTGAATIAECRQAGVPVLLTPRDLTFTAAAEHLARQTARDGIDILLFQSGLACPIDWLAARLAPAPVKISINIGSFMFNAGLHASFYDNPASMNREQEYADANMGRPMILRQGTDIAELDSQPALPRSAFGIPADAVVMGVLSNHLSRRMSPQYMNVIADLLARHPETWFLVLGTERLPDKMAFFRARGVARRVVFGGRQLQSGAALKVLDIYANEFPVGGSQSVIEAMACSVPVVAMRWSAAHAECAGAEVVGPEYAVEQPDLEEYQRRLRGLIVSPAARAAAGHALRRRAENEYSVALYVDKILAMGKDML